MSAMFSIAISATSTRTLLGKAEILHALDLRLPAGRWTAVVGPNGAGKSTLLRVLAGLLPTAGTVTLHGRDLRDWPARERARQLAWLGQGEPGAEDLSAYDVALLGRLPHRAWLAPPTEADHAAARQALQATQVWDLRARRPVGQRAAVQLHHAVGRQQAGQHAQQRRFASAVGADDGGPARGGQPHVDGVQYLGLSDAGARRSYADSYFFSSNHGHARHRVQRYISHNR